MTSSNGGQPVRDEATNSGRSAGRRRPLIVAIGLGVVAALLIGLNERAARSTVADSDAAGSGPVSLSVDPLLFAMAVPDLKFVDNTERSVTLSDFKGRLVLLNIWATWCVPCRKEMPSLDQLQANFDPAKFLVLTLSIDRAGLPAVRNFYAELGLKSLGIYVDQSGAAAHELGFLGIPGTMLINSDGLEIGRRLGPAKWDSSGEIAFVRDHLGREDHLTRGASP
jgi:thiol-disulfide isomerase/thioredoxin